MKNLLVLPFAVSSLMAFSQSADTATVSYRNTFKGVDNIGSDSVYFNVFKFKDNLLLLKDIKSYDGQPANTLDYLEDWKSRAGAMKDGGNYFLLNNHLKKASERTRRNLKSATLGDLSEADIKYKVVEDETVKVVLPTGTMEYSFMIYRCTNRHTGSPHSGTDKEAMKRDYGCTSFRAQLL